MGIQSQLVTLASSRKWNSLSHLVHVQLGRQTTRHGGLPPGEHLVVAPATMPTGFNLISHPPSHYCSHMRDDLRRVPFPSKACSLPPSSRLRWSTGGASDTWTRLSLGTVTQGASVATSLGSWRTRGGCSGRVAQVTNVNVHLLR
jgi:hypothetical protein